MKSLSPEHLMLEKVAHDFFTTNYTFIPAKRVDREHWCVVNARTETVIKDELTFEFALILAEELSKLDDEWRERI